ncbi:Dyp-type peroxidase [Leisingera sp. MMG026]|uniref:Dyp-type peroxidase n=1 Tax=Leisingera sp. MMG026 TaxID=2909982 RepID=UPI001F00DF05|nr:Dyp-type peroxidase [Leisingera sp. MMG026]MCF6433765.1 Dyp-type peroxidase [Leisingera sp. MMG026]
MAFQKELLQGEAITSIEFIEALCDETSLVQETDDALRRRSNQTLSWMQPGLVYPAPFQCAINLLSLPDSLSRTQFADVLSEARSFIHSECGGLHGSVCLAFRPSFWKSICAEEGLSPPSDIGFSQSLEGGDAPEVVARSSGVLQDSPVLAWFLVKADTEDAVQEIVECVVGQLQDLGVAAEAFDCVFMSSRHRDDTGCPAHGGRVLGGRFSENLRNPSSPSEILEHVLIGKENPASAGGAFVFTQRFHLNWPEVNSRTSSEVEKLIGREPHSNELIPSFDARSHIRSSHTYDADGHTIKLLRIGLPFGTRGEMAPSSPLIDGVRSASTTDEAGIYFIGMAKTADRIERVLESQFGSPTDDGFGRDRLLNSGVLKSDLGAFFYAPNLRELAPKRIVADVQARAKKPQSDWKRFPAIDWDRFNRHYKDRSKNGWMYYNHQDYLYHIGTRSAGAKDLPSPISMRVQFLLERMFARWDDTWYRSQKPEELAPLRQQLERFFSHPDNRDECEKVAAENGVAFDDAVGAATNAIMDSSIAIRAAWAKRLLCWLAARKDGIGGRGKGGMDTADVHPLDLLAGSMPAQSLSQGRYFINYARDDDEEAERYQWYAMGLGPNSGVGHVVPGYDVLLQGGISGVEKQIGDAEDTLRKTDPERAAQSVDFYAASRIALKGLADHLAGLRETAQVKLDGLRQGEDIERQNLQDLINRLTWLASGHPPRNVLEALQLVFTGHSTLHLCGEPVAVGRLDRLLRPFFENGQQDKSALQEAIDCFWIKLAEKALLNRIFIDDRQEIGNMAMGHRAGSYPKGQSVNQWIQQLTVGGKNPDGSFEHSEVTIACLQASARLPFNAPVLSLRVSRDMPKDWRTRLIRLAAFGQMSGGASPILMHDDKIIPAMAKSGDDFGPPEGSPAAEKWSSTVRIEDAHNYAADGCYEPQFVGANWFTLGGAIMLKPLEYALNEGRDIQSAGPVHLLGRNVSFRSKHVRDYGSYDELEEVYFKHFAWGYAKQMEGSLRDFGRMESVCPAPLLSLFINDCLKKGQDIYGGGARYNVFGPCFTALANAINALWAIKTMCFDKETACTTLEELLPALLSDWGGKMIDPLIHPTILAKDVPAIRDASERFQHLRSIALDLPKWGRNQGDIDLFGNRIAARVAAIAVETMTKPKPGLAAQYVRCAETLGTKAHPFGGFSMQPGVGTFASYVEQGIGCSASADGRLSGQPLATDMSPSPSPLDFPATHENQQAADGVKVLEAISSDDSFGFANGAPIDINVSEDMGAHRLCEILDAFVDGAGSNVLTVTTADQDTFLAASHSPEAHDLLRVRMGGWTEMFVAMYAVHQQVHPRRPYSI